MNQIIPQSIFIANPEKSKKGDFPTYQKVDFYCQKCKKLLTNINFFRLLTGPYCRDCKRELTNIEKYGCKASSQNAKIKEQVRQRNLEKYGYTNPTKVPELIEKRKQERLEKYGVTSTAKLESVKQKAKETFRKHFGCDNVFQSEYFDKKRKSTNLLKYGTEFATQSEVVKEKTKQTIESLGKDSFYEKKNQKRKEYYLKAFGVENNSQLEGHFKNMRRGYQKDSYRFDSKLELGFYEYLTETLGLKPEVDFEMQKKFPIEYFCKEKRHFTFVDFYIIKDNKWVECKGSCFFDKEGNPVLPFGKNKEPEKQKELESLWQSKYEMLKKNNVVFITNLKDFEKI